MRLSNPHPEKVYCLRRLFDQHCVDQHCVDQHCVDQRGATLIESAVIGAILVVGLAGAILYLQDSAENRVNTGRSTFGCAQMCDPAAQQCICDDTTGQCSCVDR